jgi:hypothetical protein
MKMSKIEKIRNPILIDKGPNTENILFWCLMT